MQIVHSLEDCKTIADPVVLAAGVFDGVHLGHQEVLAAAREEAARCGAIPGVLTFSPHPAKILAPDRCPRSLTLPSQKMDLLAGRGMRLVIDLPFTREFAGQAADAFLQDLRSAFAGGLRGLCAGSSWSFGCNRTGTMQFLREAGPALGIIAKEVPALQLGGETVSSTRIRKALAAGDLCDASQCLGRPFTIRGVVQQGAQLGRQLGFPTANLALADQQLPPNGVYAGLARIPGGIHPAAVNLGSRPTVSSDHKLQVLEAHLLDFQGDLYGVRMDLELHKFLRAERKFDGPADLQMQIARDVEQVRAYRSSQDTSSA